jgi:TRAP-type C4-dicarboxylate transport system permease small subunit
MEANRRLSLEEYVLAVLLMLMVGLNFTGIVCRYWLHYSLSWIEEIQLGLFVWVVFLSAGLTIVRNIHLGFSAFVDRLPSRFQMGFQLAGRLFFLFFFALLAWFGSRMVLNEIISDQRTPALGWPEWMIGAAVPVGAAVAVVRIVHWFVHRGRS